MKNNGPIMMCLVASLAILVAPAKAAVQVNDRTDMDSPFSFRALMAVSEKLWTSAVLCTL